MSVSCRVCNHDFSRDDPDEDGIPSVPVVAHCSQPGCDKPMCDRCEIVTCLSCDQPVCPEHQVRYRDGVWCAACVRMEVDAGLEEYAEAVNG